MDTNSKGKESETKESAIISAENTSFVFGNGKLITPQKSEAKVTSNLCIPDTFKSPLNFSAVTVEQLGITPESFIKNSSGKASSHLKKSRRRSAVGARGSPETNHLICFIAQQRNLKNADKSPLAQNSPFQGSPVLHRNANSLKERISAFQSAFHSIRENKKMADCPESSETEREVESTDFTKKEGPTECRQSGSPVKLPSKQWRISYQSNSSENLTDAERKVIDLQKFNNNTSPDIDGACTVETSADLSEKSFGPGLADSGCLTEESIPLLHLTEASNGIKVAGSVGGKGSSDAVSQKTVLGDKFTEVSTDTVHEVKSPVFPMCKRDVQSTESFVPRSVLKKPSVKPFLESLQEHRDNLCEEEANPNLISNLAKCYKEQKSEDQENSKVLAFQNVKKRKRVTFGEDLSPEVFDESLPANTPLHKGGTPVCKKDLSSIGPMLLEQSPVPDKLPQPNFDDKVEDLENIEPLQVSFAVLSPPSNASISENFSGIDTFISNNHEKISSCKTLRITRTSTRRKQLMNLAEESVCNLNMDVQQCKEKKINRRKSQEAKCTNRALPKKNQAVKRCRKKRGKGKQSVQKSLYGSRDIASKKPLLSPIPEIPEICEMTPSGPSHRIMCSDDSNSNGLLEEVKPPTKPMKRKNLLPQSPENLHMNPGFAKCDVLKFCQAYRKSSSSLGNHAFDQDSHTNAIEVNENIPEVESKLQSEHELKNGTESETNHISFVSGTVEPLLLGNQKPAFILKSQEFSAGDESVENLCQILKISKDFSESGKEDNDLAIAGKLKSSHLMFDSQKEFSCLEDVLIEDVKETKSQCEGLERKSAENSNVMSCKERKHRRRSIYYPDGQSLPLGKNGNHKPAYSASSSVEISLENSELYKDLSDSLEQTFKRINSEIKVRRSTRLQKDLENEGLVWISLPLPSTSCNSQKTKRRTICTFDSRGLESMSFRKETGSCGQNPCLLPSVSDKENGEGSGANSSNLPEKRRKSFCISTLASTKNTTQSKYYKRRTSLNQKGESFLNK
ncbi:cell division cycle-associated protein 2 [Dasypus novemcinctus]|uniref:cell division cycle-associated protein 2 n=1 Tax=Dasypus novemcinctus TaxID=9361 RepID=UPI00265E2A7D|nr:cell division cycle-associated protein 2 [Dasypus novemcinctus]